MSSSLCIRIESIAMEIWGSSERQVELFHDPDVVIRRLRPRAQPNMASETAPNSSPASLADAAFTPNGDEKGCRAASVDPTPRALV